MIKRASGRLNQFVEVLEFKGDFVNKLCFYP